MAIKDLQLRQGNVDIEVDIVDVGEVREFEKFGRTGRVANAVAKDETGDIITGTYTTSTGNYDILMTGSIIDRYHVFSITSSNSSSSGCYYQYSHSSSSWSSCYSATGAKLYGTPRTYRTNIEQTSDEMMEKRRQEQIIDESMRSNRRLTDEDQKAFKRYKQLLQILNSSDKEPLRNYLRSFRNN